MDNTQQYQQQQQPQMQPYATGAPQYQQQQQQHQQQHVTPSTSQTPVITTPVWIVVLRGLQFFLAVIILGLAAALIHLVYLDELGLALAVSLFTWIIVLYSTLSEKLPSIRQLYQIYAVLALDFFLVVLWLSSMGSNAARRATFIYSVNASCDTDGSLVNSGRCTIFKRYVVMNQTALAMLSSIAGLSALQFIMFLITAIWTLVTFLKWRKTNAPGSTAAVAASQGEIPMESKQPLYSQSNINPPQQQQFAPQNVQQQQQHPVYPPQSFTPAPQQQQQQQHQQQFQEMPANQGLQPQPTPPPQGQGYDQQYPQQPYNVSPATSPPPQGQGYSYPPQELR